MGSGEYCHLGLKPVINKIIVGRLSRNDKFSQINLLVNIDGALLTGRSSEKEVWTILVKDVDYDSVFLVGIYHGAKKPDDPNEFLKQFVEETIPLINEGFIHHAKTYTVRISTFVCDSPAKSFILNTKYHSGKSSCSKCLIEETYFDSI